MRDTSSDDAQTLNDLRADNFRPQVKGHIVRFCGTVEVHQLRDHSNDDEQTCCEAADHDMFPVVAHLYVVNDDPRENHQGDVDEELHDTEAVPEDGLV